ncbi:uncharacterized protein LOC110045163 [Orbicella faveolata]|uniref:uncharacterized protein LOC110045163 n=1 Tax=Orbicella faveolata TaxID=48498 RepID=UPI0009E54C05|nr:uncharacterized protein LOC110045163 [Orbicella faveolata]
MKITLFFTFLLVLILASGIEAKNRKKNKQKDLINIQKQIAGIQTKLSNAGSPDNFAVLDKYGNLPQDALPARYDHYSAYQLAWQSLHISAAAACRGSSPSGVKGPYKNIVLARDKHQNKTCNETCPQAIFTTCDAELSITGKEGKATANGKHAGTFYNCDCDSENYAGAGGDEVAVPKYVISSRNPYYYYSFCCGRKICSSFCCYRK